MMDMAQLAPNGTNRRQLQLASEHQVFAHNTTSLLIGAPSVTVTPYANERSHFVAFPGASMFTRETLPPGTRHVDLVRKVAFTPWPASFEQVIAALHEHENRVAPTMIEPRELFVGQLPHAMPPYLVAWMMCCVFGAPIVCGFDVITKRVLTRRGVRVLPTGGMHATCDAKTLEWLQQVMHKRVLIDCTGLWFAASPQQQQALDAYTARLQADGRHRGGSGMPYTAVVLQESTSGRYTAVTAQRVLMKSNLREE